MLVRVLTQLAIVLVVLIGAGTYAIIGLDRLRELRREYRSRLRAAAPALLVLVCALLLNGRARDVGPELSWVIGWNITARLYDLEGEFVVWVQSHASPPLTAYFSFIYIYGYVFLLVFPLLAYLALEKPRPLREILFSYTFNYVLGLVCYVLIIAYGPRNMMPELVDALLYETWPEYQYLTRQVNRNTNVFPSLHTSLAVTVAILAYRTREQYPAWLPIAGVLAVSVAISTMYLGIHWGTDVLAGLVLAAVSVRLAVAVAESDRPDEAFERLLAVASRVRHVAVDRARN